MTDDTDCQDRKRRSGDNGRSLRQMIHGETGTVVNRLLVGFTIPAIFILIGIIWNTSIKKLDDLDAGQNEITKALFEQSKALAAHIPLVNAIEARVTRSEGRIDGLEDRERAR